MTHLAPSILALLVLLLSCTHFRVVWDHCYKIWLLCTVSIYWCTTVSRVNSNIDPVSHFRHRYWLNCCWSSWDFESAWARKPCKTIFHPFRKLIKLVIWFIKATLLSIRSAGSSFRLGFDNLLVLWGRLHTLMRPAERDAEGENYFKMYFMHLNIWRFPLTFCENPLVSWSGHLFAFERSVVERTHIPALVCALVYKLWHRLHTVRPHWATCVYASCHHQSVTVTLLLIELQSGKSYFGSPWIWKSLSPATIWGDS